MSWIIPSQVASGEVQNAQPHQYHASLVIKQYLTYSMFVCNDDIAMVLRWEGPMTCAGYYQVR